MMLSLESLSILLMNVTGSYRQLSETHIGRHETYPVRGAVDSPEDTGKGLGN